MSLRSTFIGLFFIIGMCAAMLYGISSYFSRDAGMRSAELAFQEKHQSTSVAPSRAMESGGARRSSPSSQPAADETDIDAPIDLDSWYAGETETASPTSLDDWYAAAGTNDGPVETTPRDDSYLINDTEPLISTDPL